MELNNRDMGHPIFVLNTESLGTGAPATYNIMSLLYSGSGQWQVLSVSCCDLRAAIVGLRCVVGLRVAAENNSQFVRERRSLEKFRQ